MSGSVLETFYILFKSNADQVDTGTTKAKKSTNDLQAALDKTDKKTQEVGAQFVQMAEVAGRAIASIFAVGAAASAIRSTVEYTEALRLSSMAIGENISDVAAWGRATIQFGGNAETLQDTLKTLNTNIREAAFTGESSMTPVLRRLGVQLRDVSGNIKTPLQLLPELAEAFKKLSTAESMHLGSQMGLDQATILLLQKGNVETQRIVNQMRAFGVVSKEDAELTKKFHTQLTQTGIVFSEIGRKLTTASIPALQWFFEKLQVIGEFASRHQTLISGLFLGAAAAISYYFIPAGLRAAAVMLGITWPVLLIVAGVAALTAAFAFLYDEIQNFRAGNDSLLGEMIKRWPFIGFLIEKIGDLFTWFFSLFKTDEVGEQLKGWLWPLQKILDLLAMILDGWQLIFDVGPQVIDSISDSFSDLWKMITSVFDKIKNFAAIFGIGSVDVNASNNLSKAQESISLATSTPLAAQTSSSINNSIARTNKTQNIDVGDIKIETTEQDPAKISAAVSTSLASQIRQAMYNIDDGVEA